MTSVPALSSKVDPDVKRAINVISLWLDGVSSGAIPVGYATASGTTTSGNSETITPSAPDTLVATGAFNYIILTWNHGDTEGIAGFEIWRYTSDDLGNAVKVGWTTAKIYCDIPTNTSSAVTYYYWVRAVSTDSIAGPYNDSAGTSASTATDPTYILEVLYNQITESELSASLNERINLISTGGEQFDYVNIWYFDDGVDSFTGNGSPTESGGWLIPADHATDPYVISPGSLAIDGSSYSQVKLRIRKTGTPVWDGTIWWKYTGDSTWDAGRSSSETEPSYDANDVAVLTFNTGWDGEVDQIRIDLSDDQSATDYFEIDWVAIGRPSPGASSAALSEEISTRISEDEALAEDIVTLTASIGDVSAAVSDEETARTAADAALASDISTIQTTVGDHTTAIEANATSIDGVEAQYTVKIDNNGFMSGFGLASELRNATAFSEFYIMADRVAVINPPVTPKIISSITRVDTTATATCSEHSFLTGEYHAITGAEQGEYNGVKLITVTGPDTFTFQVPITPATPATIADGYTNIVVSETTAKIPFIVQSGVVYMDVAMIKDATITSAKIGSLAADKITSGYLAVARIENGSLTSDKISVSSLEALSTSTGALTVSGDITCGAYGSIHSSGKDSFADTTAGFYMGYDTDGYKFSIGTGSKYLKWDGSDVSVGGSIIATGNIIANNVTEFTSVKVTTTTIVGQGTTAICMTPTISVVTGRTIVILGNVVASSTSTGQIKLYRGTTLLKTWSFTSSAEIDITEYDEVSTSDIWYKLWITIPTGNTGTFSYAVLCAFTGKV